MPSRAQRTFASAAIVTGSVPLVMAALAAAAEGEPVWACALLAAAGLIVATRFITRTAILRPLSLVLALALLVVGAMGAYSGGLLLWPGALCLLGTAFAPSGWPLWKAALLPFATLAACFAVAALGYLGYSCLRPSPMLEVTYRGEPESVDLGAAVIGQIATADGYEYEFERGAGEARDAAAARVREQPGVASVRTRDERCD